MPAIGGCVPQSYGAVASIVIQNDVLLCKSTLFWSIYLECKGKDYRKIHPSVVRVPNSEFCLQLIEPPGSNTGTTCSANTA